MNILKLVYENLTNVGIPVAYGYFRDDENIYVPYIVYGCTKKIVSADSDVYLYDYNFNVELYYRASDNEVEEKFREVLHNVKSIVDYEQSILNGMFLLRATFNILDDKEI